MKKNLQILMITNPNIEEFIEDKWIAESFRKDGHTVTIVDKFYDEAIEKNFDIFLKRNCWSTNESDFVLGQDSDIFKQRIIEKTCRA